MTRNALLGATVFGLAGAAAAYVWTAFEFPFAMLVPAALGWFAVIRTQFDQRKALLGGAVGGVSFTAVFMLALLLSITDGSPFSITAWMSAVLAAAVAGALTGWVLGGARPAIGVAAFTTAGMLVAVAVGGLLRTVAPAAVDVAGPLQYGYFALAMGLVATIVGAAAGAAVSWVRARGLAHPESGTSSAGGRPSAA